MEYTVFMTRCHHSLQSKVVWPKRVCPTVSGVDIVCQMALPSRKLTSQLSVGLSDITNLHQNIWSSTNWARCKIPEYKISYSVHLSTLKCRELVLLFSTKSVNQDHRPINYRCLFTNANFVISQPSLWCCHLFVYSRRDNCTTINGQATHSSKAWYKYKLLSNGIHYWHYIMHLTEF